MNTLKQTILGIGSKDFTHDEYLKHQRAVKDVLGSDAALAFGDAVTAEAEQYFIEEPEQLPMLWKRLINLAREEGKV
jgi:hypothetical protein